MTATREEWLGFLWKIARPVLENGANRSLRENMPVRGLHPDYRRPFAHLEACGRTLAGLAPWLEVQDLTGDEARMQGLAREQAQALLASITDPKSVDFLNFNNGTQPLVDAAYLAQAILRAPRTLWQELPQSTKRNIHGVLVSSRNIKPHFNNWLLFSALIEAFFFRIGAPCDVMRIDCVLRQLEQWYVGDGHYADGPIFHLDYYNSYVIHPFLMDIAAATVTAQILPKLEKLYLQRAQRYCVLLERMISPEGALPVVGRSLTYRCGSLHAMAQLALLEQLPGALKPGQVRSAMTAVIRRALVPDQTFDDQGWLTVGACGDQPGLAENYISTGSVYMASLAFLPLGLAPSAAFWCVADEPFTSQQMYSGRNLAVDKALNDKFSH